MSSEPTTAHRLAVSRGWRWKFLWRIDEDAFRLCVLGVLVEWARCTHTYTLEEWRTLWHHLCARRVDLITRQSPAVASELDRLIEVAYARSH